MLNPSVEKKVVLKMGSEEKAVLSFIIIMITYIAKHKVTLQALEIHTKLSLPLKWLPISSE